MGIKTTGLEIKSFWNDESVWKTGKDHLWVDEMLLKVDGKEVDDVEVAALDDATEVVIEYGYLEGAVTEPIDLLRRFRKWRKDSATTTVVVELDKADQVAFAELIKSSGLKVKLHPAEK